MRPDPSPDRCTPAALLAFLVTPLLNLGDPS